MSLQKSGEDYLESILVLKKKKGVVRSIDVAHHMGFSKPSVSRAVGNLKKDGLLEVGDGGELILTEAGTDIARNIYQRHTVLSRFFMEIGVPEEIALEDACLVEHVISQRTFDEIQRLSRSLQQAPDDEENAGEAPPKGAKEPKEDKGKKKKKKK